LRDTAGVAKRNLLRIARTPLMLLVSAIQPALLLVLFRYVLGGAIQIPGGRYVDFVVPAIFVEAVLIGGMTTAIGLAEDMKSGIIDRFRRLPMSRAAVLAGRTVADLSRSVFSLAVMVGLGLLVGFRFHSTAPRILAGMAVILAFGYAFSWMYAAIGLATKDPESAQIAGILPFFVLMFASNAIVPVDTMPGWLQDFARNQPLSVTVSAVRALLEGGAAAHYVWQALAWAAAIFGVFFTLSIWLYRNATSLNRAESGRRDRLFSSVVEDRQVEQAEPLGVREEVERDDPAVSHRHGADRERLPAAEADHPGNPVDQHGPDVQPELGVGERLARHRGSATQLLGAACRPEIGPEHDVRIEHGQEPIEVAVTVSREKRVGNLALRLEVRVRNGSLCAHAPARPAGELTSRLRGAIDDRRDLVEGHGEDVVQDEREPLRRSQRLEHDEQRQPDGIGQQRLVLGIDPVHPVDEQIGEPPGERLLAA
jgi:ABC transporter DrrB family efflux protein